MELTTFKLLIDITIGLCDLAKGLFVNDKKILGEWMIDLGKLIDEVADSLEQNRYPHTTCAKMQYMANQFYGLAEKTIDDPGLAQSLAIKLHQTQKIELLFGELSSLSDRERAWHLMQLRDMAGTIQAAGGTLAKGL